MVLEHRALERRANKLYCVKCLHICHKKYSVWALALKAIRLWQWVGYQLKRRDKSKCDKNSPPQGRD